MAKSQQTDELPLPCATTLAKPLAPEDLRVGDFVTVLHIFYDLPSFLWNNETASHPRDELVRLCYLPEPGGVPLKVKSLCLPFVLVKQADGEQQTLDMRKVRLARLDRNYSKKAWKLSKKKKAESCKRA